MKTTIRLVGLVALVALLGACVHDTSSSQSDGFRALDVGQPQIDLQAVEQALWSTKGAHAKDAAGWMSRFEDEVNAIYFASLRRANPKADPTTLMKQPVRVDAQKVGGLLRLYGYLDKNGKKGFQEGQDTLLFAFEQTKSYQSQERQITYGLRDGEGYYFRHPQSLYTARAAELVFLTGFFLYPDIWFAPHWRTSFAWWGPSYWQRGRFARRYQAYYRQYPRYRAHYRRTYAVSYRPRGWRHGPVKRKARRRIRKQRRRAKRRRQRHRVRRQRRRERRDDSGGGFGGRRRRR